MSTTNTTITKPARTVSKPLSEEAKKARAEKALEAKKALTAFAVISAVHATFFAGAAKRAHKGRYTMDGTTVKSTPEGKVYFLQRARGQGTVGDTLDTIKVMSANKGGRFLNRPWIADGARIAGKMVATPASFSGSGDAVQQTVFALIIANTLDIAAAPAA